LLGRGVMTKVDWVWVIVLLLTMVTCGAIPDKAERTGMVKVAEGFSFFVYQVNTDGTDYLVNSKGGITKKEDAK
jgi:hypothetical protein